MDSFPNLEPVCCSISGSNCCFLTCIQISQEASKVAWYSCLLKNFSQFVVIYTVKGFGIINKAEVDISLELSCFFDETTDVGNLISGSSAFCKSSLNIWNFTVHVLLKPDLENFEHYFASVWDECNCEVVWTPALALPFFGIERKTDRLYHEHINLGLYHFLPWLSMWLSLVLVCQSQLPFLTIPTLIPLLNLPTKTTWSSHTSS